MMDKKRNIFRANFTMVSNEMFDLIPHMSEAELKVALIVERLTTGWQRESAHIPTKMLMQLTGMVKQSVLNGRKAAVERGIFEYRGAGNKNFYAPLLHKRKESGLLVPLAGLNGQLNRPNTSKEVGINNQQFGPVRSNQPASYINKETEIKLYKEREAANELTPNSDCTRCFGTGREIIKDPATGLCFVKVKSRCPCAKA